MADKKISELTNITGANLANTDEFVVVDTSASETKAITYGELKKFTGTITSDGLTVIGDGVFGDVTTKYNRITINGGHVNDGDNDYGLTINSFEPAITLLDRSTGAGSSQIFGLPGGMWLIGDTTNDGTIGHSTNTTDFLLAKFEPTKIIFYTGDVERMRIDGSGRILIGTSASGGSKLRVVDLPTSSAGLSSGDIWNDAGTLKIV